MEYAVAVSPGTVSAWSRTRLAFEPRGWQVDYRRDLRAALRQLAGGSGQGLVAAYHTPNADFADLENVLLYNVGMAVFGPLIGAGITCHRYASTDGHHHMSYRVTAALPDPGGTQVLGMVAADLGSRLPVTAGQWWAALRPQTTAHHRIQPSTPVMVDVVLAGPGPSGARLANLIKSMLDGLVSCFHAHDGSQFAALLPRLATLGPAPAIWQQLMEPSTAALGVRPLVRPYRDGIVWNPGDELCSGFRIRTAHADGWSLHASLLA